MLIKRLYDENLAQASWLVGCAATGEALVVDPNRDVEQYLAAAAGEQLRISHVTETHIHADFVSGVRELAGRTGARVYLSGEGGPDWRYRFAGELDTVLVHGGSEFRVGNVLVQVLHTPGHTPEHICFMVTDTAAADRPMGVFTGDFVFVGDVGRPDLLERAAGETGTMAGSARLLYRSLQRFKELPDWLQLWPGHGAGSACGKALGAVAQSTLGYERLFNWGLAATSEAEFVEAVLAGQPEPPPYFAEMKRVNRDGPRVLGHFPRPERRPGAELAGIASSGALVLDVRPWAAFRQGHVPGSLNIPLSRSFTTYAGSVVPYDRDYFLLVSSAGEGLSEAVRDLALIGLDRVRGYFDEGSLADCRAQGLVLDVLPELDAAAGRSLLRQQPSLMLDVRGRSEWEQGHVVTPPGAAHRHVPLGELTEHLADLPRDRALLVYCKSGSRSAIAASMLVANGFRNVHNLGGGLDGWVAAGQETTRALAEA